MQPEQAITSGNYHITKPRKALNKGFLKVKPNRSQIERFIDNLKELPVRTNNTASEEFHKNLVTDFLKKILEHGFLIGKIGRKNVCALVKGNVEKPNDISGVVYISIEDEWRLNIAKELRNSGYEIDMNLVI